MRYEIDALENVIMRTLDMKINSGQQVTIDDPSDRQIDEIERSADATMIRYDTFKEEQVNTYAAEDTEEKVETSEIVEIEVNTYDQYYCPKCDHSHYTDSKIGQEHLEELDEENIKWEK